MKNGNGEVVKETTTQPKSKKQPKATNGSSNQHSEKFGKYIKSCIICHDMSQQESVLLEPVMSFVQIIVTISCKVLCEYSESRCTIKKRQT